MPRQQRLERVTLSGSTNTNYRDNAVVVLGGTSVSVISPSKFAIGSVTATIEMPEIEASKMTSHSSIPGNLFSMLWQPQERG